ncbi:hypothetical protein PIB30_087855, partial [Stylosanthes scabra]|nr:hypothetical protein [Stylosanthes scabra]
ESRVVVASVVAGANRGKNMVVKGAETGHDESAEQVKKREDGAVNGGGGLVGDSGGVRVVECGGYGGRRWCMVRLQRLGVLVHGGRETEGLRRWLGFWLRSGGDVRRCGGRRGSTKKKAEGGDGGRLIASGSDSFDGGW